MKSKKLLERELQGIREQVQTISTNNAKLAELAAGKDANMNWSTLYKLNADQSAKTTIVLKEILKTLQKVEYELSLPYEGQGDQAQAQEPVREAPISSLDAKILQHIQIKGLTCADDVKGMMGYRGRNAASARLNRLYAIGLLERHQLGHMVFYKYDAGKAANIHVVAPPAR